MADISETDLDHEHEKLNPKLSLEERRDVREHAKLSSPVIYEVVRQQGVEELSRPIVSLWWSAVAAGIAISTSVFCKAALHSVLPDAPWREAISNIGYSAGFIIVILGRLQLFTENTITVVLPLLAKPTLLNFLASGRLWGIVCAGNLLGCFISAAITTQFAVASPDKMAAALEISRHFAENDAMTNLLRGIPAGFLVASIVWMLPNSKSNEFWVILFITYMIGLGDLTHVVAGSTELFLLLLEGEASLSQVFLRSLLPTFTGNVIGGTGIFALIAYAQVREEL